MTIKKAVLTEIEFKDKIFDFGEVQEDSLLIHRYYFKNVGNEKLIIDYVNPDCTCTGFTLSNDTIMPMDSAYVELKYDTKDRYGKQKLFATMKANTETKMYAIILKANVID
ncbi:MAG: DUF1573 domain-containing protein [Okeania sp. SIO3C4]|nr:DUF1573 domain-containing protein [Okeania sp. SIO3C4]